MIGCPRIGFTTENNRIQDVPSIGPRSLGHNESLLPIGLLSNASGSILHKCRLPLRDLL
jgi:hypothetical protein